MARGAKPGERRGGRAKGVKNKASIERQQKIEASGITPLDVMIENMRFAHHEAGRVLGGLIDRGSPMPDDYVEFKEVLRLRMMAQECAKDAAAYVHPKFAAIDDKGKAAVVPVSFIIEG